MIRQEGDPHTEGEETYLTADMREEFEQLKEEPVQRVLGAWDVFLVGENHRKTMGEPPLTIGKP